MNSKEQLVEESELPCKQSWSAHRSQVCSDSQSHPFHVQRIAQFTKHLAITRDLVLHHMHLSVILPHARPGHCLPFLRCTQSVPIARSRRATSSPGSSLLLRRVCSLERLLSCAHLCGETRSSMNEFRASAARRSIASSQQATISSNDRNSPQQEIV